MTSLLALLACVHPPAPTAPAAATTSFSPRSFTTYGGETVAVPGEQVIVLELIRSADW